MYRLVEEWKDPGERPISAALDRFRRRFTNWSLSVGIWMTLSSLFVGTMALLFLNSGCSRKPEPGRLLASVNSSELYMQDVAAHVDTTSAYAVRNYVSHWVSQELLFDEAKKEGLDDSPDFKERIKEFSRQLAITMLLDRRIYEVPLDLTADEISNYYNVHHEEFVASVEIARVNMAAFSRRNFAVTFRNALVSGTSWNTVFGSIPSYAVMDVKDSVYMTSATTIGAVWNVVQSLSADRVSFPIQVDSLTYVVQVNRKIRIGDPLPLDYVAPMIKERMTIEKRRLFYERLLDSLRSVGNFQVDPSVAIRDTSIQE